MADLQCPQTDTDREPLTEAATNREKTGSTDSWYAHDIPNVPDAMRQLFEQYSCIPPAQVIEHIEQIVCTHSRAVSPLCTLGIMIDSY